MAVVDGREDAAEHRPQSAHEESTERSAAPTIGTAWEAQSWEPGASRGQDPRGLSSGAAFGNYEREGSYAPVETRHPASAGSMIQRGLLSRINLRGHKSTIFPMDESEPGRKVTFGANGSMILPVWVIAKLRVKADRARAKLREREERVRTKTALHPEGRTKVTWDLLTTGLLIYTLFEVPFHMAFITMSCDLAPLDQFNLFVDIMFCIDILVSFNTGVIERVKGEEILNDNHQQIAVRYLTGWFFIDFMSSLPLDVMVCGGMSRQRQEDADFAVLRVFKVARFLKLIRLIKFARMLSKWQAMSTSPSLANSVRFFKLAIGMMLCSHIMGCCWQIFLDEIDCGVFADRRRAPDPQASYGCECHTKEYLAPDRQGQCTPVNWLYKYDSDLHDHGDAWHKYVACFYFTMIGLSTVGFGDITPANTEERVLSVIYTLIGAVVFAVVIGSVTEIAQRNNKFEESISRTVHRYILFIYGVYERRTGTRHRAYRLLGFVPCGHRQ